MARVYIRFVPSFITLYRVIRMQSLRPETAITISTFSIELFFQACRNPWWNVWSETKKESIVSFLFYILIKTYKPVIQSYYDKFL